MVVGEGRLSFGRWFQIDWGLKRAGFCSASYTGVSLLTRV